MSSVRTIPDYISIGFVPVAELPEDRRMSKLQEVTEIAVRANQTFEPITKSKCTLAGLLTGLLQCAGGTEGTRCLRTAWTDTSGRNVPYREFITWLRSADEQDGSCAKATRLIFRKGTWYCSEHEHGAPEPTLVGFARAFRAPRWGSTEPHEAFVAEIPVYETPKWPFITGSIEMFDMSVAASFSTHCFLAAAIHNRIRLHSLEGRALPTNRSRAVARQCEGAQGSSAGSTRLQTAVEKEEESTTSLGGEGKDQEPVQWAVRRMDGSHVLAYNPKGLSEEKAQQMVSRFFAA